MPKLKYSRVSYLPNRQDLSVSQLKAEYQRLRVVGQKRLKTISRSEFVNTPTYRRGMQVVSRSVKGKSESELRKMLYDVYQFTSNQGNTIRGMRRKRREQIERVNEIAGEEILNNSNYFDFINFINDKNIEDIAKGLDSGQVMELWKMNQKGLSKKSIIKDASRLLQRSEDVNAFLDKRTLKSRKYSSYDLRKILEEE